VKKLLRDGEKWHELAGKVGAHVCRLPKVGEAGCGRLQGLEVAAANVVSMGGYSEIRSKAGTNTGSSLLKGSKYWCEAVGADIII
jgi:hypothetical protein